MIRSTTSTAVKIWRKCVDGGFWTNMQNITKNVYLYPLLKWLAYRSDCSREFHAWWLIAHLCNGLTGSGQPNCSLCQISSKLVSLLLRYCDFLFFKMATADILDFWNCEILLAIGIIMPNFVKIAIIGLTNLTKFGTMMHLVPLDPDSQ